MAGPPEYQLRHRRPEEEARKASDARIGRNSSEGLRRIVVRQSAAGGGCGPHGAKRRRFPLPSRSDTLRGDKGERGCVWPPERHFTPHYPETAYEADRRRQRGRFPRGIKNAGFGHQSEPCGSLSAAGYLTSSNSTSSGCEESPAAEPAPAPASAPEAPAPALALALAFAPPCACCWA